MRKSHKIMFWVILALLAWLFVYFTVRGELISAMVTTLLLGLVGAWMIYWKDK